MRAVFSGISVRSPFRYQNVRVCLESLKEAKLDFGIEVLTFLELVELTYGIFRTR